MVAIPKLYFPIDPQDNMEEYLKNTEKVAAHTLSMLDREQKINNYLKTFANQLVGDMTNTQMALWRRSFTLSTTSWMHSNPSATSA